MVNNRKIVSLNQDSPPAGEHSNRKIAEGPLYAKEAVLKVLELGSEAIIPWTRKCKSDLQNLGFDTEDVLELLKECLINGDYKFEGSEWCENCPGGPIAASDGYEISRSEWVEHARKNYLVKYYIKFAIGTSGKILLLVSCHL